MSDPLWSDERIRDRYHALVPCEANMGEMEYWNVLRDVGERVSYELRDEYEGVIGSLVSDNNRIFDRAAKRISEIYELRARIAELEQEQIALWHTINTQATYAEELEAQLAQTWQPLPDGAYGASNDIIVAGQHLCMFVDGGDVGDNLPDNIRLCRRVTQPQQPAIPPDVRETLRNVMQRERNSLAWHITERQQYFAIYKRWPDGDGSFVSRWSDKLAAIDAALAWLDAQEPTL